jgi:two-component system cell cycle sensor histidine kinase/response regulator CckA
MGEAALRSPYPSMHPDEPVRAVASALRVLIIEHSASEAALMVEALERAGFSVDACRVENEEGYLRALHAAPDLILSDYDLPQFHAFVALAILRQHQYDIPFIVVSRGIGEEAAVEAMKRGATDCVSMESLRRLEYAASRALSEHQLKNERKLAEFALSESELRYRSLVEQASDAIFTISASGHCLDVNRRGLQLFGCSRSELYGKSLLELLVGEDRERATGEITRLLAGDVCVSEWKLRTFNGTWLYVEISARQLEDGSFIAMVRDLSARKVAEERLSRLAASAPGAMHVARLSPDGTWSVAYASPQVEDILGLAPQVLMVDAWRALSLVHADDLRHLKTAMETSLRTLEVAAALFRYEHPLRGRVWIEVRSMPTREPDGSILWHGFLLEASERVELEEQLRQSQKMDAFGQLASGVAHDFNNLLTIIQGNAGMLVDATWSEHGEYLREIIQASKRASNLTRQLLMFSRRQPLQLIDLDLSQVVGRMTKMLSPILGADIELDVQLAQGLSSAHADPGMIEQILLNLAVNARDAMPTGGKLTVSTRGLVIDEDHARHHADSRVGPCVCLCVADSGPGIPFEIQARVFEPFFTTKEVGKGTGLGLATVHGIVKQHRGWIQLESEPGKGAAFHIYFPVAAPAPVQQRRTSMAPRDMPPGQETILVVEDELAVRIFVTKVLKRCGYRVLTAASAVSALELWNTRKDEIQLLFTDMVMPDGMTGRELAEHLVAEKPELKVIFTSGYSAEWASKGLVLMEGVNFLQKPYEPQKLAETLRNRLDQSAEAT